MSFDIGDPVQARHGRAVWEAQVARLLETGWKPEWNKLLGDAVDATSSRQLDGGEFFAQAALAIDEEETMPGIPAAVGVV